MKKLPKRKKSKSLNILLKIIPVLLILFVLLGVYFIIKPKANDDIYSLGDKGNAIFENINPNFTVQFGVKDKPDTQWVRFEAKPTAENPFEEDSSTFLQKIADKVLPKSTYGIEMSLKGVQLSQTEQLEEVDEDVLTVAELLGTDEIKTSVELVESGRIIGENNQEPVAKKTVLNKSVVEGVDIEYQILEGIGLKEEIVIRSLEEYTKECEGNISECKLPLNEFIFDLKIDEGLELKYGWFTYKGKSTKGYYFTDTKGRYVAHFLHNWAIDEIGNKTYDVDFEVLQKENNHYEAKVTVDINWLFNPERVYPVRIDPSIVHDTKTEFDMGTNYNTEVVDGPKVRIKEAVTPYYDYDTFESPYPGGNDDWTERNSVDPVISSATAHSGQYSLYMPTGWGRNFEGTTGETGQTSGAGYNTNTYPYMCMAYKIPSGTDVNMLIYILDVGWKSISMTQPETQLVSYAKVATWRPMIADNNWQYKCINLDEQLDLSLGAGTHSITAVIWHTGGGTYNTGPFYIDDFLIAGDKEHSGEYFSSEIDLGQTSFLDDITLDSYGDATNEEEPFSTTGLVAQWNFNEKSGTTAAVSGGTCGTSCNGTLTAMTTTGQDVSISSGWTYNGRKSGDGALVFDGTDDRVVINSHSTLGLTTGLTIEAWVKPYSYSTGGYNHILDKHGTYGLSIYNGKPSLYMTAGGWWHPDIEPLELNKWSHVVAQYNGINKTIYVNGIQVAQALQSGSIGITSNAVGIGATSAGPYYFNGVIDTTRVYSRAITTSEILSHYKIGNIDLRYRTSIDGTTWSEWNGGSEKKIDSMDGNLCSSDIHGLVAYYPMDETSGTVMYDAKSSNNANVSGSYITDGKQGKSRSFINSGDAAIVSSEISLASSSYTIETWFKWPLTASASWNTLTRGSTGDHQVIVQRSTMLLGSYSQDAASFVSSGYYINTLDDGWHHLAAVASDGTTRFFIDGKHVGTAAFKSTRGIYAIGNYQGGGQQFGTIDEFKIYDIELTPQQIYRNFLQGAKINSSISTEKSTIRVEGDSSMRISSSNYASDGYTAAYWKLDEVSGTGAYLKDSSRFSNDGTPVGTVYSEGKFDGARDFNGSTNYLNIGSAVAPALPVTISAWVKPDSVHSGHIVNTGKNQAAVHYHNGVWMTLYNNQVNIGFGNNTACGPSARREVATASATVPVGEWSHVVGVMESDTVMKIYINGESVTLGAYGGTATFLANDLSLPGSIGAMTDCGSGARTLYFDGKIDEVAIINRAYSSSEIKELYNAGRGNDVGREITSDIREGILMTRYPGNVGHPTNLTEMLADFQLTPVYTKEIVESAVHRDFGDYYNTMYSTEMEVLVSGTWQFAVDGDDAIIASVGGTTVAGKYGPGGQCNCFTYAGSISLTAGSKYTVNVWQEEDAGGDSGQLWFKDPNDTVWKHFSVSNIAGSAKLRAYDLPESYVNTSSYITNGMPSLSEFEKPTALPFWIASDKVGTNLELSYGENNYVNYEPDRYTVGQWDLEDRGFLDSSGNNLHGRDYYGIEYGIKSSNLTLIANQWNGVANNGELDITCPGGDAACYIVNMDGEQLSTPSINYGAALIENAVQNAFLMYSPSLTGQGITPYTNGSNNFIAVRYTSGVWQYDNNSTWVTFTPTTSNILVASLVTGNPTITGLAQITINPPTPAGGIIGNGMQFSGSNHINLKSPAALQMTGNQTIEMWLYPTDLSARRNPYNKAYGGEGTITQEMSGVLNYYYGTAGGNGTPYQAIGSIQPVIPYTWNHIAVVRDLRNMTLTWYINGKMTNTIAATYASATASSLPAYIGTGYTNPYVGVIDEVRISNIPRSADEIRQSYEIGKRTHPIKVNFKANLLSGNLISSSGDYSFSIDERPYGGNNYIEHLEVGEKIIVKENYNGVEYIAQGNIATRNKDTGAVTVSSWDSGSTFPSGGYTVNSTVFKWQKEYVDLRQNLADDVDDISRLTFRKTTDVGANFWIDDARLTSYGKTSSNTVTPADSYLYGSSDDNLVAYFPMDETSGQLVKNVASTNSGIATGTIISDGYNSKARNFNGTSDYIDISSPQGLPSGSHDRTVSAWIYVNGCSGNINHIFHYGNSAVDQAWGLAILCSTMSLGAHEWDVTAADFAGTVPTGEWVHVAITLTSGGIKTHYINGQNVGTLSSTPNTVLSVARIGTRVLPAENFNGLIDEIRVYNRALSADEILQQYDSRINYIQYDAMFSRWSNNTDQEIYLYGVGINYTPDGPTMDQVMRHGKWFSGGTKQPYWWAK